MPVLEWLNKKEAVKIAGKTPYKLLNIKPELSYGQQNENMIIKGDNLDALKALLPYYKGRVKCIYIDPPYNTGSAFEHYDDNLEHSTWLTMMYPRLELLREILAEDGSIWISIDDDEQSYLKTICDEIFGRKNFVSTIVWNSRKSKQNDIVISLSHNYIFLYAKNRKNIKLNRLPVDATKFTNPDNDPRGVWVADPFDAPNIRPNLTYIIKNPNTGIEYLPPKGRCWRTTEEEYYKYLKENRILFGRNGTAKPQLKRFLTEAQYKGVSIGTLWDDVGTATEATQEIQKIFDSDDRFSTPKPERLIERVLALGSNPGDLVLDSFLGSGTTAAVAHKMGRRYIGIEMGEHALTHAVPRLKKVINGEQGGISKSVKWEGGGGFSFYDLGETIFDEKGNIDKKIDFKSLAFHIWFSETKTALVNYKKSLLLGIFKDTAYYLLYNGILGDKSITGGNVLTSRILEVLPLCDKDKTKTRSIKRVIYGEACRLGIDKLRKENIIFKQTPYDIKVK